MTGFPRPDMYLHPLRKIYRMKQKNLDIGIIYDI